MLIIVLLLSIGALLIRADPLFDLAYKSAQLNCPYAGNLGLDCPLKKVLSHTNGFPSLPARIGIGWNSISGEIGLPVAQMNFTGEKWEGFILPEGVFFELQNVNISLRSSYTFPSLISWLNISDTLGGSFSLNSDITQIYQNFFGSDASMTVSREQHFIYQLSFDPTQWFPDPLFLSALNYLPSEYNSSIYQTLLDYWGTSVIVSASFGGLAEQRLTVKTCAYETLDITNQAQLELLKNLYPEEYQKYLLESKYLQERKAQSIDMFGGDPTLGNWSQRIGTLITSPALLNFSTIPLDQFIWWDPVKRINVARAISEARKEIEKSHQKDLQTTQEIFNEAHSVYLAAGWILTLGNSVYYTPYGQCGNIYPAPLYHTYNLAASQNISTKCVWVPEVICERDVEGSLQVSLRDPSGIPLYGGWVHEGCSLVKFLGAYSDTYYAMCCTSCVPSIGEVVINNQETGYFECGCPGF